MQRTVIILGLLVTLARPADAVDCGVKILFDGKGAGQVIFDGTVHAAKGLICADCHERHGLTPALFQKKTGSNTFTMRKMEMGQSCGHCHETKPLHSCEKCHHK